MFNVTNKQPSFIMSLNLNSSDLLNRTIDLTYANKKRSNSLKWSIVNAVFFLIFAYDLSCKCPGYTTVLHYVEYLLAGVLGANLLQHALRLMPRREPPLTITPLQQRLLGLSNADLDSSFRVVERSVSECSDNERTGVSEADTLSVSLSPARRSWHSHSPPSLHSSRGQHSPLSTSLSPQRHEQLVKDEFIADQRSLSDYLKEFEVRSRLSSPAAAERPAWGAPAPPAAPHYQLASLDTDSSKLEEGSPAGSPQVWWRLHLDPQRLTQWNLNLRLWIHLTILERLVREMDAVDEALAKHGLLDVRCGQVSAERLRATAGAVSAGSVGGSLRTLLPFLEPFPDQRYIVQRIRELAIGGCISNYKWNGGGSDWDDNRPTDAELVLHLVATYLDGQLPSGGRAAPFSSEHVTAAPAHPPRGPHALAIHRVTQRPPHYVLALRDDTLEVSRGRNNLLHTLVLFVAAAGPALRRVQLGPAGLNMLWIIGRSPATHPSY